MAEPACMSQMVYLGPRQHTVGSSEELAGVIYQFVEITQASKRRRWNVMNSASGWPLHNSLQGVLSRRFDPKKILKK